MTVGRVKSFPYPERVDSVEDIETYLKKLYRSLTEEQIEKITDFEDMDIDSLQINDLTVVTSFKPTVDATVDLGAVGTAPAPDYRFRHLYLSGNLSDETNTLTVANAKSAYTHSQIAGGDSVHVSTTENTQWDSAYSKRVDTWGDGLQYSTQTASVDYNTTNLKITAAEINTIQDIATTSNVTFGTIGSGKLTVDSGADCSIIIKGTSTGDANVGWIGFYDSDGTTRRGHIGDGSSGDDDIYIGADTGFLRLTAASYIGLGTHTYFPDDVVMSFGASLDYSIGFAVATDTLQIVDGATLGSNVRLKLDSSGHFDFSAGNLVTTGTLGSGAITSGTDGSAQGTITLWDGGGGNTPGYVKVHSPNGTAWYLFVEDDGTVKVHNAAPTANADGDAIGDQTD